MGNPGVEGVTDAPVCAQTRRFAPTLTYSHAALQQYAHSEHAAGSDPPVAVTDTNGLE